MSKKQFYAILLNLKTREKTYTEFSDYSWNKATRWKGWTCIGMPEGKRELNKEIKNF